MARIKDILIQKKSYLKGIIIDIRAMMEPFTLGLYWIG